jgi:hypothetical protein
MHAKLEDWKNGWFGLRLAASPQEIEQLIAQLQELLKDNGQHFHIGSDYKAESGLGDVEISVQDPSEPDNLFLTSLAMRPGESIP